MQWANALIVHNRLSEAADVAAEGLGRHPGLPSLAVSEGFGRGMTGEAGPWLDRLEAELRHRPGDRAILGVIPQLALRAGRPERAAQLLEADASRRSRQSGRLVVAVDRLAPAGRPARAVAMRL